MYSIIRFFRSLPWVSPALRILEELLAWKVDDAQSVLAGSRLIRYVIVKVNVLLLPPLVHPRSPELPLGVLTATLAVPGPEIRVVVSVTCSCVLLTTVVATVSPLITTTDAETKWEPLTDRTKPSTVENAIVSVERDEISGDGRALPHNGLIALQPVRTSKRHNIALRHRTGLHAEVMIAAYTRTRRGKWSQLLEGNMRRPNRSLLFSGHRRLHFPPLGLDYTSLSRSQCVK
jgi:hypothetical protein